MQLPNNVQADQFHLNPVMDSSALSIASSRRDSRERNNALLCGNKLINDQAKNKVKQLHSQKEEPRVRRILYKIQKVVQRLVNRAWRLMAVI